LSSAVNLINFILLTKNPTNPTIYPETKTILNLFLLKNSFCDFLHFFFGFISFNSYNLTKRCILILIFANFNEIAVYGEFEKFIFKILRIMGIKSNSYQKSSMYLEISQNF